MEAQQQLCCSSRRRSSPSCAGLTFRGPLLIITMRSRQSPSFCIGLMLISTILGILLQIQGAHATTILVPAMPVKNETELIALFNDYLVTFHKSYDDPMEYQKRFASWKQSHEFLEQYRQEHPDASFTMDLNHMSDRTTEEYKGMFGFKVSREKIQENYEKKRHPNEHLLYAQQQEQLQQQQAGGAGRGQGQGKRRRRILGSKKATNNSTLRSKSDASDFTDEWDEDVDSRQQEKDDDKEGEREGGREESHKLGRVKPMNVPTSLDWRYAADNPLNVVAVTPIKNQGSCGACWGFTTVAAVEGAVATNTNILNELSVQELIDCVNQNDGCSGGDFDYSFDFAKNGLASSTYYRFQQGPSGSCKSSQYPIASKISGYFQTTMCDTLSLLNIVATRPVAAAIDASCDAFIHYSGGIFTDSCGSDLNHAITIVGYGTESGTDYWIVKNSWGSGWGTSGYGKIERGYGSCGVSNMEEYAFYAVGGTAFVNGTGFYNDDALAVDGEGSFLQKILQWKYLTLTLGIAIACLSIPVLTSAVRSVTRSMTGGSSNGQRQRGGRGAARGQQGQGSIAVARQAPLLPRGPGGGGGGGVGSPVLDSRALTAQDLARLYALQSQAQPSNQPFQCIYCTYLNPAGVNTCQMCGNVHQFVEINDGQDRSIVVLM